MKKFIIICLFLFSMAMVPKSANAAIFGFGGYNVFAVPCTCTGGTVWYVWYAPLLFNSVPVTGALAVGIPPVGLWYSDYKPLVPGSWSLGKYFPGVQACWQYAGTTCVVWPTLGYVYQVGSSLVSAP